MFKAYSKSKTLIFTQRYKPEGLEILCSLFVTCLQAKQCHINDKQVKCTISFKVRNRLTRGPAPGEEEAHAHTIYVYRRDRASRNHTLFSK